MARVDPAGVGADAPDNIRPDADSGGSAGSVDTAAPNVSNIADRHSAHSLALPRIGERLVVLVFTDADPLAAGERDRAPSLPRADR